LAQYSAVNSQAEQTASQPFQTYSGEFVSPVNAQQQQGIAGTNAAANEAQPYYGAATSTLGNAQANATGVNNAATGLAAASGEQVNAAPLTGQQINSYLSPYLGDVLGTTNALANQNNNIAQAGQLGTAISSGAFGGDRTGIAAANLNQQNSLAEQATDANILNTGYNTALSTAQQQQGVNLSAGQANRAALGSAGSELASIGSTAYGEGANTASELGSLGSGAQAAGLSGAQAQIAAGTLQQQTAQAQDTAEYNQFLQQQSYPFQVDQFLASIAEGTGALSGSTTTTTQPGGFFSDKRLKHDIKKIGKTYDGQTLYSYKMHGDNRTHIGLIAQNVEKKHPEAVGLAAGYKTVDYGKATEAAANRGHFYSGGVVPIRKGFDEGGYAGPYGDMSSILATQENMYQPNQTRNRNIPNQTQNHQLAVASGSPTPPPTGANNVNQAIGLGQKGYQAYNHFTQTPTPDPAVTNTQIAVDPQMQALQQSPALSSGASSPAAAPGLGAAGASDAAPAASGVAGSAGADAAASAAPAAASVAAPAAADAAAGVAGGAAVDAGATEAAALAAEYAAADAAVAVAAAKRGGAIKRQGLAGGGSPYEGGAPDSPYSDPSGQMDIPDDPNTSKLQTAGPLKKQPTGLQTAMTLGSQQGASDAVGSIFSNQGLGSKRGGRIGYDIGGGVDPSADPDLSPVVIDPSDVKIPEKGLAAADMRTPAANDDAAPAPEPQKRSALAGIGDWWERNKANAIPALEGLAAMGTAPTRHLGVALAAGLGAGAQAYYPTQQQAAQVQQTQLQNQMAQQKLNYLTAPAPASPGPTAVPSATGPMSYAPADLRKQNYVPPVLPAEQARLQYAYKQAVALGSNAPVEAAKAAIQQRIQSQTAANQNDARQNYDDAYSVATNAKDPALRSSAAAVANAYQQWTGDQNEVRNGVPTNIRTNQPWIGDEAARISTQKYADMMNDALTKVPVPTGVPGETQLMPKWRINGGSSPQDYLASQLPPGTPGMSAPSAAPLSKPATPAGTLPVRAPAPIAPQKAATTASSPATPAFSKVDFNAYADPKYKLPVIPTRLGTTPSDAVVNQMKATSGARQALQSDAEATAQSSGAALQFAKAARQIMDSKGAPVTGFFGPVAKTVSSVFGKVDATNYQEVAKYLGNLAVQTGKANFSNTTDKNTALQFEQLNPSTANTDEALKGLLDSNIRTNQYTLDTANRATNYLDQGSKGYNGDPQKFFRWNQEHYPRAEVVNAPDKSVTVNSKADYDALPKGATYIHNGRTGVKQ
jgi:hypothetical protein